MGSAHDWIGQNMPPIPDGVIGMRSFHIAPDRGMTIIWFDSQEHLDATFPYEAFQQQIAERFEARTEGPRRHHQSGWRLRRLTAACGSAHKVGLFPAEIASVSRRRGEWSVIAMEQEYRDQIFGHRDACLEKHDANNRQHEQIGFQEMHRIDFRLP